jgi:type IV pilus assembly protein PilA
MSRKLQARSATGLSNESGFTLIELMVVVLIIAILLAIAIPTFLGAQRKATDRSAQVSLQTSVAAAKTIYADSNDFIAATPTALRAIEPAVNFLANSGSASSGSKEVSVKTTTAIYFAAAMSAAGMCYFIKDDMSVGRKFSNAAAGEACTGDAASTTASSWRDSW